MINYSVITMENRPVIVGSYGIDVAKTFEIPFSQEASNFIQQLITRLNGVTTMTDALVIMTQLENYITTIPVANYSALTYGYVVQSTKTGDYHLSLNGKVVEALVLPPKFINDLSVAYEKGLDLAPMVKFIILLAKRALFRPDYFGISPSMWMSMQYNYISRTYSCPELYATYIEKGYSPMVAAEKSTIRQTPFTSEGLLVMKKVVAPVESIYRFEWDSNTGTAIAKLRSGIQPLVNELTGEVTYQDNRHAEDLIFEPVVMGSGGDAFNCAGIPGHIIKVGAEIALPNWDQVDCNPFHSCVKGLHVGNQDYIRSFENDSSVTLNVLVSPLNIGTVAINQDENVMRVKEYFPLNIKGATEKNRNYYNPTAYAEKSANEWAELLSEFISELNDKFMAEKEKINTTVNSINFLHT